MKSETIANKPYAEINIGDSAELTRTLTKEDIDLFARASGDYNPTHVDADYTEKKQLGRLSGHSMWGGAIFSSLLGNQLPGAGTVYRNQSLEFHQPIKLGDSVVFKITAKEKKDDNLVVFECLCIDAEGNTLISGTAQVIAPKEKSERPIVDLPGFEQHAHSGYEKLLAKCEGLEACTAAIAHPCDESSLGAVVEAANAGLLKPILVGPEAKIKSVAEEFDFDISQLDIIDVPHSHASADKAVELASTGQAELLMKGSLHTDEIMGSVVRSGSGLKTERRLSHAYIMDVPTYPKTLIISDAAINIAPNLLDKADICQNAIDLAHALGIEMPKVAILSAVETIRIKIPSTMEAASLCKMADRGQITGAELDGPLAMDNAINKDAAETKGIISKVAGEPDILIAPDLEAGNILVKQLTFLANAEGAGIALGAKVPIILTSRADPLSVKLASCAVGKLVAHHNRKQLGL